VRPRLLWGQVIFWHNPIDTRTEDPRDVPERDLSRPGPVLTPLSAGRDHARGLGRRVDGRSSRLRRLLMLGRKTVEHIRSQRSAPPRGHGKVRPLRPSFPQSRSGAPWSGATSSRDTTVDWASPPWRVLERGPRTLAVDTPWDSPCYGALAPPILGCARLPRFSVPYTLAVMRCSIMSNEARRCARKAFPVAVFHHALPLRVQTAARAGSQSARSRQFRPRGKDSSLTGLRSAVVVTDHPVVAKCGCLSRRAQTCASFASGCVSTLQPPYATGLPCRPPPWAPYGSCKPAIVHVSYSAAHGPTRPRTYIPGFTRSYDWAFLCGTSLRGADLVGGRQSTTQTPSTLPVGRAWHGASRHSTTRDRRRLGTDLGVEKVRMTISAWASN